MSKGIKIFGAVAVVAIAVAVGGYFVVGNAGNGIAAGTDATTVAVVNGADITRGEVNELAKALTNGQDVPMEQVYPVIIEQLINDQLLGDKVDTSGIANDPEVTKRLDLAKEQITRGLFVERFIEKQVSDKDVKAEYAEIKKRNSGMKEIHARHILVDSEDKAKALIKKLDEGSDFAELAKESSEGPTASAGGDLGYFTKESMVPEFSEAAFALKEGKYSAEPTQTKFGWHVIYLEDQRTRPVPKLAEVENLIKGELGKKAVQTLIEDLRKDAEITVYDYNGNPIEKAVN